MERRRRRRIVNASEINFEEVSEKPHTRDIAITYGCAENAFYRLFNVT